MSEHSTAELKRQLDAATSVKINAQYAENRARKVYEARLVEDALAEYAAQGIVPGCKVIAVRATFGGETRNLVGFIGVEPPNYYGNTPRTILGRLKKDGTPSKAVRHIPYDRLEPFPGETA